VTVNLEDCHHIHFVGIGGIGMSALARYLLALGYDVSGCDRDPGEQGDALRHLGAGVESGHAAEHVHGADLIVTTSAVAPDNPDVREAIDRRIPVLKRAEILAAIVNARRGIAVAGTHGKTTTSALIGHILTEAGLDPTILVGGISANLGSNTRVGGSDLVVAEADEYDASFLRLRPEIAVITNVEPDHLDFYGTLDRLHAAFRDFARGVTGTLVVCADDPLLPGLVDGTSANVITYGIEQGQWRAAEIAEGSSDVTFCLHGDVSRLALTMRLAGLHNVRNAAAAALVARLLGVADERIAHALASFRGVQRRFEIKDEVDGVLIMDDYAHHPTEIRTNLVALRRRYDRPVRLVFQPHTFSRTKHLMADFARSFDDADSVYLLDIYAARERETLGVSGRDLANRAAAVHTNVRYTETADRTLEALLQDVRPGDVVVTMGAGDVYHVGTRLAEELRRR
jgi:UDP-N-acetylmuramate--alanine ligase